MQIDFTFDTMPLIMNIIDKSIYDSLDEVLFCLFLILMFPVKSVIL